MYLCCFYLKEDRNTCVLYLYFIFIFTRIYIQTFYIQGICIQSASKLKLVNIVFEQVTSRSRANAFVWSLLPWLGDTSRSTFIFVIIEFSVFILSVESTDVPRVIGCPWNGPGESEMEREGLTVKQRWRTNTAGGEGASYGGKGQGDYKVDSEEMRREEYRREEK